MQSEETKTNNSKNQKSTGTKWSTQFGQAWRNLKKVTHVGIEQSEKLSQYAKKQTRKGLLIRERGKLYKELGELAFHLLEEDKIQHPDLQRCFERIVDNQKEIQKVSQDLQQAASTP